MFSKEFKGRIGKDLETIKFNNREILDWLTLVIDKNKAHVDELGVKSFGPFHYYSTMGELCQDGYFFQVKLGSVNKYVIPRELDKQLSEGERNIEFKEQEDLWFFDFLSFQTYFLLCSTGQLDENNSINSLNSRNYQLFQDFVNQSIKNMDEEEIYSRLSSPDDFFEELAIKFIHKAFDFPVSNITFPFVKKVLYGFPIKPYQFKDTSGMDKDIVVEMEGWPFFVKNNHTTILHYEKAELHFQGAFHIQGKEWIIPSNIHPSLLWVVLIFSEVKSIGQMLHVAFTTKSVQSSKRIRSAKELWEELQRKLPSNEQETALFEELWDENHPIVKKKKHYVYYQVEDTTLKNYLLKEARKRFPPSDIHANDKGLFISLDVEKKWDEYLEDSSLLFQEKAVVEKEEREFFQSTKDKDFKLKEWEQLNRLAPISFQLMTYKENMLARLIRQSQAFKLPIIVEDTKGQTFVAEIKTLHFDAGEAEVTTYRGNKIKLREMKRLAIYHPEKDLKFSAFR